MNFIEIKENLDERMTGYTHSAAPTADEVIIAWLVCEVDRLNEILKIGQPKGGK